MQTDLLNSDICENEYISYSEFLAGSLDVAKLDSAIIK